MNDVTLAELARRYRVARPTVTEALERAAELHRQNRANTPPPAPANLAEVPPRYTVEEMDAWWPHRPAAVPEPPRRPAHRHGPVPLDRDDVARLLYRAAELGGHLPEQYEHDDELLADAVDQLVGLPEADLLARTGLGEDWRTRKTPAERQAERDQAREQALAYDWATVGRIAAAIGGIDPAVDVVQAAGAGAWGQVLALGDGDGHDHVLIGRKWDRGGTGWQPDGQGRVWRTLATAPTAGSAAAAVAIACEEGPRMDPWTAG